MKISFLLVFSLFGIVSQWAEKALADGRITLAEALILVAQLAALLKVDVLFDVPLPGADLTLMVNGEAPEDEVVSEHIANPAMVARE